jgi:hypothetical protein
MEFTPSQVNSLFINTTYPHLKPKQTKFVYFLINANNLFPSIVDNLKNLFFTTNGLTIPFIMKKNDLYTQMALENKIKYCRIIRKLIRGKYKFYVQLVFDAVPPVKFNKETGEIKNPVNEGEVLILEPDNSDRF